MNPDSPHAFDPQRKDLKSRAEFDTATKEQIHLKVDDASLAQLKELARSAAGEDKVPSVAQSASPASAEAALPGSSRVRFPPVWQMILMVFLVLPLSFCLSVVSGRLDFLVGVPAALYWSYWLMKISNESAHFFSCKRPVSNAEIAVIALASVFAMPLTTSNPVVMALDPFFWLWCAAQAYFPYRFGKFLEGQDKNNEHNMKHMGIVLGAVVAVLPATYALFSHCCLEPVILGLCWSISQVSCLSYFVSLLTGKLEQSKASKEEEYYEGNYVLRYRAFADIERWFQYMFGQQTVAKGVRLVLLWVLGPAVVVISVMGLSWVYGTIFNSEAAVKAALTPATGGTVSANLGFITYFVLGTISATLALIAFVFSKPTHLAVGQKGLRFLWRRPFLKSDGAKYVDWSSIKRIFIDRRSGAMSNSEDMLCFERQSGETLKIKLNSFDSFADREVLLNSIKHWAPKVARDARVIESLQPPADYSYTELWLQALSAPPKRERFQPLQAGARLKDGRYQIIDALGVGGQGVAYHSHDTSNDLQVVLKEFILPVYVDVNVRKSALEQFENEARILRQLDHPQIVKLIDFFVEDHRAYLVLELIDGASLRKIVEKSGPLSEEQVRGLARQMCGILKYLHACSPPVVHRDFTPDNLILGKDGVLKLIDFNVAQEEAEATTTGTVVGKHAYLPPEQFRGMPVPASDIYAFGATLQYLLIGEDPEPISVSKPQERRPQVSDGLDYIVSHATALELEERYLTIKGAEDDLKGL